MSTDDSHDLTDLTDRNDRVTAETSDEDVNSENSDAADRVAADWVAADWVAADRVAADSDAADTADVAAASALARARDAAAAKGLRPGRRPLPKRRPTGQQGGRPAGWGQDRTDGRDPSLLGDQMDRLMLDRGWTVDVAVGSVMGRWKEIVGAEVAQHCAPLTFSEGVLIVRAESTAWATQLRLMSSSILGRLETEVGKDAVSELRVLGPSAPSWTRGLRKSTGPGPRDTYG